ncbi:MAG: hypothetical protein ACK5JR_08105 [Tropicimonas sp.]|uniref:hypothetical protein n=1 Tax=Tropicimonas sp. TaxID=2067044 RepID=UPI003A8BDEC6
MRLTAMVCAALLTALPVLAPTGAGAQEFQRLASKAGLVVLGTAQEFEVLTSAGVGKSNYFCAAGDFAHLRLGAPDSAQLLVASGRVASRYQKHRRAIVFRLADGSPQGRFSLHIGGPFSGQVLSVGHARGLCHSMRARSFEHRRDD